jgi:hypothetical protein
LPPILPVGTAVVLRRVLRSTDGDLPAGSVAQIVHAPADPSHQYRLRCVGGAELSAVRGDLSVLSHFKTDGLADIAHPLAENNLYEHVIFRCIVGSRAYGLENDASDTDRRGIYLPPAEMHWSLYGVPEQLENDETQECYWELQKFLMLALKANPNVLECLYSPLVESSSELADRMLAMREAFLSKLVYQTYNGYVLSQFRKLEQSIQSRGSIKWKHAMHLIRLLLSGITVLREGLVPVRVDLHRDRLLAIRDGAVSWEDVDAWRLALHAEFENAFAATSLPDWPDYARVNDFLIDARRSRVDYRKGSTKGG